MLPEFGVAYVKRVRFFRKNSHDERLTDLIVAACKKSERINISLVCLFYRL